MIKNIKVENFKSLKDISVQMSNLNLFTGMNGMGKSSLIQVLLLLRQSHTKNKLFLNGDLIEIGNVKDALCDSRITNEMIFELQNEDDIFKLNFKFKDKDNDFFDTGKEINFKNIALFEEKKFQYLNAERLAPKRYNETNFDKINHKQLGKHGEYAIHYLYENQHEDIFIEELAKAITNPYQDVDNIKIDYSLKSQLEAWLSEVSPNIVTKPEYYRELNIVSSFFAYKQKGKTDTNSYRATNIGFGISYILPVVLSILIAEKDDIVIIENPEAHLHPKGQTALGELMAIAGQNGVQLFIETHSDHIFDGIRIATKQGKIQTEKVNVLFFDRDEKEHITKIEKIEIDEDGRFAKEPPKNFFDEFEINMMKLL
ncbi:MAG: hypothetical protein B6I24_09735 [Bacteroidetes bacterium 4572_128]|nr:MAG: hypothetical protein B6I24_09735 [Bacteroidetes bacterium 4572_128]